MSYNTLETSVEKIPLTIFKDKGEASQFVARQIAAIIQGKNEQGQPAVLGLATGSSPLLIYRELIRLHKEEGLSFKNVITFNLDEYYPMKADSKQSYHHFMYEHFFNHLDIKPENVFIPDGSIASEEIEQFCLAYENKIDAVGGIDVQLLGIGRSGHIGFNEPGSPVSSVTRLVQLDELTIEDAAKDFGGEENVPVHALTMGIKTILKARKIFFVAWGEAKSDILQKAIEGPVQRSVPASFLQNHTNVHFMLDNAAASKLSRFNTPWLTGVCEWNDKMKKKAVIWLSRKAKKPILKLTDQEYKKFGLSDLLKTAGSAYNLNISVYNQIQRTITGWPGGKPKSDDTLRPERSEPFPKRSIVFSPHPDDDVISMGGTLLRLVEQGHDVHVAYQTSGNIAVFDDDARRFADFALAFSRKFGIAQDSIHELHHQVIDFLKNKEEDTIDSEDVLKIKGLIRQGEASAACRFCDVKEENIHFLEMPFYESGSVEKNPLGEEDIQILTDLLQEVQPHQIFAAGDLQDPHGTHAVCLHAIMEAVDRLKDEPWMKNCYVWLYRGAWQEWEIEDIEMAVPISPEELMKKRKAIFKHQSQKDSPVYPGKDKREFWQRAEDRNRTTAKLYDELGLTEYEAIEAFKRYLF
jgi:glucosamine-6-phosphate deaminase